MALTTEDLDAINALIAAERAKTQGLVLAVAVGNVTPSDCELALRGNSDAQGRLVTGIRRTHGGSIASTALDDSRDALSTGMDAVVSSPPWFKRGEWLASTLDNL